MGFDERQAQFLIRQARWGFVLIQLEWRLGLLQEGALFDLGSRAHRTRGWGFRGLVSWPERARLHRPSLTRRLSDELFVLGIPTKSKGGKHVSWSGQGKPACFQAVLGLSHLHDRGAWAKNTAPVRHLRLLALHATWKIDNFLLR